MHVLLAVSVLCINTLMLYMCSFFFPDSAAGGGWRPCGGKEPVWGVSELVLCHRSLAHVQLPSPSSSSADNSDSYNLVSLAVYDDWRIV